jgi:hypothetical protein
VTPLNYLADLIGFGAFALAIALSSMENNTGDYWVFGAGLVAGALMTVALRRDFRATQWDGKDRRRAK